MLKELRATEDQIILNPMLKRVSSSRYSQARRARRISAATCRTSPSTCTPPFAPPTAGGYLLQYELYVTDWYDKDITIRAVDMMVGDVLPVAAEEGQTGPIGKKTTLSAESGETIEGGHTKGPEVAPSGL